MKRTSSFRYVLASKWTNNLSLILVSVGSCVLLVIYLYANWNGLGMTADSFAYLDQAKVFRDTLSFSDSKVHPYFPFQVSLIVMLSFLPAPLLYVVNLVLYIASYCVLILFSKKILNESLHLTLFALTILFSPLLLLVHSYLWTEPGFIFIETLTIWALFKFIKKPRLSNTLSLAFLFLLLCLQRKAGLLIGFGTSLGLVLNAAQIPIRIRYSIVSMVAALIVVLYLGPFNIVGERPMLGSIVHNLINYSDFLSAFLLPRMVPFWLRIVLLVVVWYKITHSVFHYEAGAAPLIIFMKVLYLIFASYFLVRLCNYRPDPSEVDRYLAPVYPIFFLLLARTIGQTLKDVGTYRNSLIVMLVLWLSYPMVRTINNARLWHHRPIIEALHPRQILHRK